MARGVGKWSDFLGIEFAVGDHPHVSGKEYRLAGFRDVLLVLDDLQILLEYLGSELVERHAVMRARSSEKRFFPCRCVEIRHFIAPVGFMIALILLVVDGVSRF